MSINSIQQAPGFNQQQYDTLIQQAQTQKVDTGLVDKLLLDAVKGGKSFDQALSLVGSDLPKLTPPNAQAATQLKNWPGIPSPGALIMSATTKFAAEQREQNRELSWKQTEAIVASMHDQAKIMRDQAAVQLALGIASGTVGIVSGAVQIGGSFAALGAAKDAKGNIDSSKLQSYNNMVQGLGSIGGGIGKGIDAGSQYVGTMAQANIKEKEAEQEQMRALRDSIRELNDALRDLIQKSLSAQNDIQSTTNQARTRILA